MTDLDRICAWCGGPIPARARRDAITCSKSCRQARHRVSRHASRGAAARRDGSRAARRDVSLAPGADPSLGSPRRFAYADPPYPGNARLYVGHPDYAGEVDHAELLSRLATYDGWALSTSAAALPQVLAEAVAQDLSVRVGAWIRGARPHATARFPVSAWEPVIYVPVPSRVAGEPRRVDAIAHGVSVLRTLPSRVIGAKPAAFCRWIFDLVGATPDDELDDLFPGSGIVGRTWALFRGSVAVDVAEGLHDASWATAAGGDA
jgi:hypothetical protein